MATDVTGPAGTAGPTDPGAGPRSGAGPDAVDPGRAPTRVAALPRMIRATMRREYDGGLRVTLMTAATLYVVSPVDVVPELLLSVFGLADDAMMITWLAGSVLSETERFLEWERRRSTTLTGALVP